MAAVIRIQIETSGGVDAVKKDIDAVKKDVQDLGRTAEKDAGGGFSAMKEIGVGALRAVGEMGVGLALKGIQAVAGAISDGIADAKQNVIIQAQTAAVIKSTGEAAGVSAQHVADYASSLSDAAGKSLFGDDQIQQSTNLLLTFTQIKGATLDAATAISVDMAQAMGGAPKDAAIQLGKALNDPVKGITALTRVGVVFSDQQKAMIQAMTEAGDTAGAQKVILDELNKEFGGSAAAAAAATGGWSEFNGRMGEAKEALGAAVLPLLNMLAGVLNDSVLPIVESVASTFGAWVQVITTADDPLQELINQLDVISPALGTIVAALADFITSSGDLGLVADDLRDGFGIDITPFINALQTAIGVIQQVIASFQQGGAGATALGGVLKDLSGIWDLLLVVVRNVGDGYKAIIGAVLPIVQSFIQAHGAEISAFFKEAYDQIIQIIRLGLQLYNAIVPPVLKAIAGFIQAHGTEIMGIITNVWNIVKGIIDAALTLIRGILQAALQLIQGDFSGAWDTIQTMAARFVADLISIITNAAAGLTSAMKLGLDAVIGVWKSFTGWAGIGGSIIDGIVSGILNAAHSLAEAAANAAKNALSAAKSALGISSPSSVFAMQVGLPMAQGMSLGLMRGVPLVARAASSAALSAVSSSSTVINNALTFAPNYSAAPSQQIDYQFAKSLAGVI